MHVTQGSVPDCHTSGCALFLSGIKDALGFGRHRKTPATSLETWVAVLAQFSHLQKLQETRDVELMVLKVVEQFKIISYLCDLQL